jgi:type IV pilus assembly protein PilB
VKILLALDDVSLGTLMRPPLSRLGHDVLLVGDGDAATDLLRQSGRDFDVLIADYYLPGRDGVDLLRDVRSNPSFGFRKSTYVMLLAERGASRDRADALDLGVDDLLEKPLDPDNLLARLEVARGSLGLGGRDDALPTALSPQTLAGSLIPAAQMLGEILLMQGTVTRSQLQQALEEQARTGSRLGPVLIARGWADEEAITRARATQMDVPYIAIARVTPEPALIEGLPVDLATRHKMLPFDVRPTPLGETIRVAIANPWDIEGLDKVQQILGRRVEPVLASESGLEEAIRKAYKDVTARQRDAFLTESITQTAEFGGQGNAPLDGLDADLDAALADGATDEDAPVIRVVNALLADAVRRRASDIHIEPYKTDFEVRYRIDGDLQVIRVLPRQALMSLTSRLKVMAEMDISERRIPQDGRIALKVDGRGVDLRVSSLPTQFGERMVLRVLDRASARLSLDQLDFSPRNRERFDGLIRRPHGIILVTGPTGSGKTTTLYASLNALRSPTTNIMTCEDPIEYELDRISQSNVNPRAGLTFATQLRAILRQDPDVVLVGEIRDAETAETAFRAALTGHLVLSTLHCNEAAGAPTRLIDMGVPPYLIASALIGAVAQRLLKRLCPHCHRPEDAHEEERLLMKALAGPEFVAPQLYRPGGCERCEGRGTRGRIGVHEVLTVSDTLQAAILKNGDTRSLRQIALAEGMVPLLGDGIEKAGQGFTTLEEVQRRLAAEA